MLFWILAALLTLAASLAVLLPFLRRPEAEADADDPAEHDIEVYRDQLAELERDAERGLIGAEQAREARAEIGRRILRAGGQGARAAAPRHSRAARLGGAAAVLAVPLVAWGVYAVVGSPGLPGQPLQARLAQDPAQASLEELVARAEAHLADNPQDGRGWDVLAPVYMRMGRYPQAVTAYRNAMRLSGASAVREAGLGEAIAAEAGGIVSAEAEDAFERALELDPTLTKARFFLATARAQDGRMAEAAEMWRSLRADLPEGSPWRGAVDRALAQLSGEGPGPAIAEAPAEGPGPTRAEIEAAGAMSDEDRAAMVEGMVSRLDARLREAPDDPAGWQRLVRSYAVLGRAEAAQDALARGVAALGADTPEGAALREAAAAQGIGAAGAAAATAPADAPGPTRAEIEAAGTMSDEDRAAMVEGMVARLDARLREAPDDPAGWQRLVRSYAVLGRAEAAQDALARGLEALGTDTPEGAALREAAAAQGIETIATE